MREGLRRTAGDLRRILLSHLRFGAVAYAVLLISLAFTALAYFYARDSIRAEVEVRFQETVLVSERALERRTSAYLDALLASRAFLIVSGGSDSEEWEEYVDRLDFEERYRGLQAMGYVRWISSDAELAAYEREAESEAVPRLRTSGRSEVVTPVEFASPLDLASVNLLGEDFHSEENYRSAMRTALDTGQPQGTPRENVLVENPEDDGAVFSYQPGFLIFVPVYEKDAPTGTTAERRAAIEGFVFGVFRLDYALEGLVPERAEPGIDFEVYDGPRVESGELLYDADAVTRARDTQSELLYSEISSTSVAGRDWSLYFGSLPSFVRTERSSLPNFVLATGLLVTLVLFSATWLLSASREKAEEATRKLEDANRKLEVANRELESFSYSVSHDLRAPLRSIDGFSQLLAEDYSRALGDEGSAYLGRVRSASSRMGELIDDLLLLSRVTRAPLNREKVYPTNIVREIATELERREPERSVNWKIRDTPLARCDPGLLRVVLDNLLGNAWKFTGKQDRPTIEFGYVPDGEDQGYYVRDNGAGFDPRYVGKLFGAFQRLHTAEEFNGTGIGLATVARIIRRHGGDVHAAGALGEGATFRFTLEPSGGPPKDPSREKAGSAAP
ncbi:sensor histidine kinase [Rubrobacter indicoceani]|uniref:sensor histidine kinase n=1 Tax=Rubrobacter indicoceani TaxID=2051957 RepID=UPI0019695402|nr:CHASE domain-containing protein [Rubrobacter indicoceani]